MSICAKIVILWQAWRRFDRRCSTGVASRPHFRGIEDLEQRVLLSASPALPGVHLVDPGCSLAVAPLNVVLVSDAVAQAQQVRAAAAPDTIAIV